MKSVLHTVKTKVDKVVRSVAHLQTTQLYVTRVHKTKVHTSLFMKMYLLHIYHLANGENNNEPDIEIQYEDTTNRDLVDSTTVARENYLFEFLNEWIYARMCCIS